MAAVTSKVKRQPSEWEKIFANDTADKDLISKIHKQLIPLKNNKKITQLKNGPKTLIDISPEKIHRWSVGTYRWSVGSTSLITGEMQSKTTMRYHLTTVRMAIIKKSTSNKC